MQKLFVLIALGFFSFSGQAQTGKWMIKLNGKLVLATATENQDANTKNIKSSDWKKKGYLEIIFTENEPNAWKRSFLFNDEAGQQLMTKDSVTRIKIPLAELRKTFAGKKELTIYTIVSPLDPTALARIRPIHLCTLKLP